MQDTINLDGMTHAEQYVTKEFGALVGKTIHRVRPLSQAEVEVYGWEHSRIPPYVIIFVDGTYMIPSCDEEGNEAGFLFLSETDEV